MVVLITSVIRQRGVAPALRAWVGEASCARHDAAATTSQISAITRTTIPNTSKRADPAEAARDSNAKDPSTESVGWILSSASLRRLRTVCSNRSEGFDSMAIGTVAGQTRVAGVQAGRRAVLGLH